MPAAGVPDGGTAACLDWRMGLARLGKARLDHSMRTLKLALWIANALMLVRYQVGRQGLVDQRRAVREGALDPGDRRQLLVFDLDQLGRILGEIAIVRHDAYHWITLEAHLVDRQRGHSGRAQALNRWCEAKVRGPLGQLAASDYRDHAGRVAGRLDVNRTDAGVRIGRADEAGMERARDLQIVQIVAVAGQEPIIFAPGQRAADRLKCQMAHRARSRAALAIALTIL